MAIDWWNIKKNNKQTLEVSGPAGSGKTSIVDELVDRAGIDPADVLYVAYVGKAAMMLTLRGNPARTCHSSFYNVVQVPRYDENGLPMKSNGRILTTFGFVKKDQLPPNIKLIVLDEGSMINEPMGKDILSFGIPIIILGDLNQLPPVFGDPFFLNKPDYILTKIMRQNADNPIIKLSQMAIRGEKIKLGKYGDMCYVIPKEKISNDLLKNMDIIICGKNATRQNINDYYRQSILGVKQPGTLIYGDKIICRQNNWQMMLPGTGINLINGLIGYVDNLYLDTYDKKSICIDFRPEFLQNEYFERLPIDYKYLFQPLTDKTPPSRFNFANKFQFAYAITAHLSQGSQYDKVLVYDEPMGDWDYYRKWLYTSITRAIRGLILAI